VTIRKRYIISYAVISPYQYRDAREVITVRNLLCWNVTLNTNMPKVAVDENLIHLMKKVCSTYLICQTNSTNCFCIIDTHNISISGVRNVTCDFEDNGWCGYTDLSTGNYVWTRKPGDKYMKGSIFTQGTNHSKISKLILHIRVYFSKKHYLVVEKC
jgi:hypothetical protein